MIIQLNAQVIRAAHVCGEMGIRITDNFITSTDGKMLFIADNSFGLDESIAVGDSLPVITLHIRGTIPSKATLAQYDTESEMITFADKDDAVLIALPCSMEQKDALPDGVDGIIEGFHTSEALAINLHNSQLDKLVKMFGKGVTLGYTFGAGAGAPIRVAPVFDATIDKYDHPIVLFKPCE